ncbi:MAG: aminoacetone oxidase family FAD-binding enzyme [Anaeroplasma bactoclasticum]|nr:aminoacetone oxidase family FAD-binding enzyme [Anaeroplasma bactoclasticum]
MKKMGIIGGGASGLMCAIYLKQMLSNQIEVIIIEKMDRVGKKILATGNGKCNLSNRDINVKYYNSPFVQSILSVYQEEDIQEDMSRLGLLTYTDQAGRIYPVTESANTVLDILMINLKKLQIVIQTNTLVQLVVPSQNGYKIKTSNQDIDVDFVIFATGGKSAAYLGSRGEGYSLMQKLGVQVTTLYPGLVGLKTVNADVKGLNGLRQKAEVEIYQKNGQCIFQERGEIQFKEDGVSGIVIMNASRIIQRLTSPFDIYIRFLPHLSQMDLQTFIQNGLQQQKTLLEIIMGILPKMLAQKIISMTQDIDTIINCIMHYPLHIVGDYGFERSQITLGGVDLREVNTNLELIKYPHAYVIGELLDIDGICGGYNLHFAFASAKLVARHIVWQQKEEKRC